MGVFLVSAVPEVAVGADVRRPTRRSGGRNLEILAGIWEKLSVLRVHEEHEEHERGFEGIDFDPFGSLFLNENLVYNLGFIVTLNGQIAS